ncbi:hypothetical protein L4G92_02320 [Neisseria sp. ZJ106]|uniref:Uncharacterized protein n=1 Tax=Neisseria lisongii TaxID=2912188 RepID=A0ABY7RJ44_9NEIS|nr:hypothetical protein [Neisseria lisongii]MCF7520888.1 hypothetical protein [Neisseria lisongii]WCL71303.1 hypothetical protein PJU73_08195 [Neisseria lisongii]
MDKFNYLYILTSWLLKKGADKPVGSMCRVVDIFYLERNAVDKLAAVHSFPLIYTLRLGGKIDNRVKEGKASYREFTLKVLQRWLALPYYLYCLRLAALSYF